MIEIKKYEDKYQDEVIRLVLSCQNDGTRPIVSIADQPELLNINQEYFTNGGYFWIASENNKLVGTIGLMNYGNDIGILKKFFVNEQYRGKPYNLGRKLFAELLDFAYEHKFKELVLDTPKNTERAHKFYEKAGFNKVIQEDLSIKYDHPYTDSDFFQLKLS